MLLLLCCHHPENGILLGSLLNVLSVDLTLRLVTNKLSPDSGPTTWSFLLLGVYIQLIGS